MSIPSQDRETLCQLRLGQMNTSANSFHVLLDNGDLQGAANRLYYAVFYGLSALAIIQDKSFSKHGMLIGWFNKEFILTDKIDRSFGKFVNNTWQLRSHGDYEFVVDLKSEELRQAGDTLAVFMDRLKEILLD